MSLVFLALFLPVVHASQSSPEYAVKAAYIYNILRFVEWPVDDAEANKSSIDVCILGQNKFNDYLDPIENKSVANRPIRLRFVNTVDDSLDCHLILISDTQMFVSAEMSATLKNRGIIVVGDDYDFIQQGGMFALYIDGSKVRIGLNKSTLSNSGLKVSALLLEVCEIIEGDL